VIATCFIVFILTVSGGSRYWRARELRVGGYHFSDTESERLWKKIAAMHANMMPVPGLDPRLRAARAAKVRQYYKVDGPLVFVHVTLLDNRSEFLSPLLLSVRHEDGQYLVEASQAVATANAVAYLSQELHPSAIYLGLSRQNLMRQSIRYFLLGEGETGLMVYTILQRLWESAKAPSERPRLFLMSD
jgi:hypothetical protein